MSSYKETIKKRSLHVLSSLGVCALSVAANADTFAPDQSATEPRVLDDLKFDGGIAGVTLSADFETGFVLGTGCGQAGWLCGAVPAGFDLVDSGIGGFGSFSARDQAFDPFGGTQDIVSPALAAPETGFVAADIVISNANSAWQFNSVNTVAGFFNMRLQFETNGTIRALTVPNCAQPGVFVNTTGTWTPGVKMRIAFEVPGNGTVNVYKDGVQIFSGVDIANFCAPAAVQGITQIRNFNTNVGYTSTFTLDNVSNTPTGLGACDTPLPTCNADISPLGGDGVVNISDLLTVIATWAQNGNPNGPRPQGDVAPLPNGDCLVNIQDLLGVIGGWGTCAGGTGACCRPDGTCVADQTPAQCVAVANSTYAGDGTTCGTFSCPVRPPNDLCANATTVLAGVPAASWDNTNALTDGPLGTPGVGCDEAMRRDIWFNYTATQAGGVIIDTDGSTGNTDTMLAVYDGSSCTPGALLACNDDISAVMPFDNDSRVRVAVTNGQQLKIRVSSFGPATAPQGAGVLNIVVEDNDPCDFAVPIAVGGTVNASLFGADVEVGVNSCFEDTPGGPVEVPTGTGKWYTVIGNGNTLTAHTCDGDPLESFNGIITVYCGAHCGDLSCVVCSASNNTCDIAQESVSWCSANGQKYWVLVHTNSGLSPGQGDFTLKVVNGGSCSPALACGCFACPLGSITSAEACAGFNYVDTSNGGCNSVPPVFGAIVPNGAAICGIGSTYLNSTEASLRDTDWFTFTVTEEGHTYSLEGSATFLCAFGLIQNTALDITACGAGQAFVAGSTVVEVGNACDAPSVTTAVALSPGTYAVFAAPNAFTAFPCTLNNQNNRYWVRLIEN
ncbi:MAG: hypothetical protein L0Y44_00270 [Phycisphaerales bacterium]|nr:hypothetical protein [Phycisphaerales bacterium]MCI0629071.1 hypothetical protein [Phycisphaerales bacterium]MCI0675631.1 hypothetical protein [Phycisphaerales bacterium]